MKWPTVISAIMDELPLVAILRGVHPDEVEGVGETLLDAGFRVVEVPLNSPEPLRSIEVLATRFGDMALVGAGTVLDPSDVERIRNAGGRLVISPNTDLAVIRSAKEHDLLSVPGTATPSEAFAALAAGADAIKAFPAESIPPVVVKAWLAVLQTGTRVLPVGGITPDNMQSYVEAGASGFGLGSALFKPGFSLAEIRQRAHRFVAAWRAISDR